jgi:hypothetical protein
MWRKLVVMMVSLSLPCGASAGPLRAAIEKAAVETAAQQSGGAQPDRANQRRGRLWTGIALLAGGGVLAALGGFELGDDENGPDDGEDIDGSDDGEDSDGWGNKAMLGGGIAAASLGGVLLITGRRSGPGFSIRPGRFVIRHTVRF